MNISKFTVGRMAYKKPSTGFVENRLKNVVEPHKPFNGVTQKNVSQILAELEEIALRGTQKDAQRYLKLEKPNDESLESTKETLGDIANIAGDFNNDTLRKISEKFNI